MLRAGYQRSPTLGASVILVPKSYPLVSRGERLLAASPIAAPTNGAKPCHVLRPVSPSCRPASAKTTGLSYGPVLRVAARGVGGTPPRAGTPPATATHDHAPPDGAH